MASGAAGAAASSTHPVGSKEAFLDVYQDLLKEITEDIIPPLGLPAEAAAWNREVIEYNVPGGKLNRGLTVVHTLQALRGDALTAAEAYDAAVVGWCIEWLQAFFLVADDVMDGSITRRGQPCWYKLPKVGLIAINDAFLLQAHLYKILNKHFATRPFYVHLVDLFTDVTWLTELGQLLDLTSQPAPGVGTIDLDRFTLERYKAIVKHKTAFYSFYLPVVAGLVLAGVSDKKSLDDARDILLVMGEYFQIQDDYLDCYADAETLGKIGTDIQDNKCSWLVVQALERANPEQKALLKANYGKHDADAVATVKKLYADLALEAVFQEYEAASYADLKAKIAATTAGGKIPERVFLDLLHKIYKRSK